MGARTTAQLPRAGWRDMAARRRADERRKRPRRNSGRRAAMGNCMGPDGMGPVTDDDPPRRGFRPLRRTRVRFVAVGAECDAKQIADALAIMLCPYQPECGCPSGECRPEHVE